MEEQQQDLEAALFLLLVRRRRNNLRRRSCWVKPWIQRRAFFGDYENLMMELQREARGDFIGFIRMPPELFHQLVDRLTPRLTKVTTNCRVPHHPGLKLAITLRYLATGNSYHSLAYSFRVPHNTISKLVREVCQAIVLELREEVLVMPNTEDGWRDVASKFEDKWQINNALGALDGKHVAIQAPKDSGTLFHNYKGFFSIILLGLVDAEYKFLWYSVGAHGSTSDCAVFNASPFKAAVEAQTLNIPHPEPLPNDDQPIPYYFLGDDAFPLKSWLMKPFSTRNLRRGERIFNYRLSRGRRVVENAFGILAARWRCILTTMRQSPETCNSIISACICLHNLMRINYPGEVAAIVDGDGPNMDIIPGAWRGNAVLEDLDQARRGALATREARQQRVYLKHYYNHVGAVAWQDLMI